jgi:aldehyde oxidoreductase
MITNKGEGVEVSFFLNEQNIQAFGNPDLTLLEFLREHLKKTGTKNGCATGHCGTCMVIVNGKATRACLIRMSKVKPGSRIETIEGLARGDKLHLLQIMFINYGALQCGYCIPGMIMSAKALLDENPIRSEDEIKEHLTKNRNLCRCTGYVHIIKAIQAAGECMASGKKPEQLSPEGMEIHSTQLRKDAIEIVTGKKQYGGDIQIENILHGKVLWSEHPHAEILKVDASEALAMPGVVAVVTAMDIPGVNRAGVIEVNRDQPAIAGREQKARYIGDSVASVFAETIKLAEEALKKIKVEYRVLQPVFSPEEAALPDAPRVHEKGNLMHHCHIERGDVEKAFKQCSVVVEHDYYTPMIEHGFLEPESGVAYPNPDGGVTVLMGTQSVFDDRSQIAEILAMPEEMIRVIQIAQGGSFGGKEDPILQPHLALGALKTKRPVKIVLCRSESLRVHVKRHAANMYIKTGANGDGHIQALDFKVVLDTGAYMSLGYDVLENFVVFAGGPYFIPNVRVDGKSWYTNNVLAGAMRGFGVNQVAFGLEQNVDEMTRALNIDPFEFRLLNGLTAGKPTIADHVLENGLQGINETIIAARDALKKTNIPTPSGPSKRIGIGVGSAVKNLGFGHNIPESAGTIVELATDGTLTLKVTHHEYGQGGLAGQVKLVVNEMGIPVDRIRVVGPDTGQTLPTGPTTASRQTFLTGNATVMACRNLKTSLLGRAAELMGEPPEKMYLNENEIVEPVSGKHIKLADLGDKFSFQYVYKSPLTAAMLPVGEASSYGKPGFSSRMTHWAYAYGTQVAIVEVDSDTGEVKVLKIIAAVDVGKLLNPKIVEGQIFGGVVQGLGFALKEEFIVKDGINQTDTLHKYNMPTANDIPEIIPVVVEIPHPFGPQGAKGFAEAPSLATAAAIVNAIYDAVGVRICSLPADEQKVKAAINAIVSQSTDKGMK